MNRKLFKNWHKKKAVNDVYCFFYDILSSLHLRKTFPETSTMNYFACFAYFVLNLSIRPAVSISLDLPV